MRRPSAGRGAPVERNPFAATPRRNAVNGGDVTTSPKISAQKIPATVITGFLGAGKTTLLRNLVERAGGRKIALMINEFGDLGVDGALLEACGLPGCAEGELFELANGCICCTVADDFLPTMRAILDRPDPPDHIVIETSGLALPKPLVQAFNWPEVRTRVSVDGVVAVIDAPAVAEGRFAADPQAIEAQRLADDNLDHDSPLEELYEDQLACADMVLINKTDLLDAGELERVVAEVAGEIRPGVTIIRTEHGRIAPEALLGLDAAAEDDLAARPSHHDDEADHDHDDFESFILELGPITEPAALARRIEEAAKIHDILRVKGFADVPGKAMRLVIQGVGRRIQHYYDRDWRPGETRATQLVIIGQTGLDREAVHAAIGG